MLKNVFFSAILAFGMNSAFAQTKIAHLNSQEVMKAIPSRQLAVEALQTYQAEVEKELQMMIADYYTVEESLIRRRDALSPVMIQIEEDKLRKKSQAITDREQAAQLEIEAYSEELNLPILEKVEKAVKIVSDRHGYEYVFDVSTLMIHNGPDITKEVIDEVLKLE